MTNFAKWNGGFVEVCRSWLPLWELVTDRKQINDQLITANLCPSDLLGFPCEHDEFLYIDGYGCQKVRLCEVSVFSSTFCLILAVALELIPSASPSHPRELTRSS